MLRFNMIKRLKYTVICNWIKGNTFTSYNKAKVYILDATNNGMDCHLIVTRGKDNDFEYETRFYAFTESQKQINSLRKV